MYNGERVIFERLLNSTTVYTYFNGFSIGEKEYAFGLNTLFVKPPSGVWQRLFYNLKPRYMEKWVLGIRELRDRITIEW